MVVNPSSVTAKVVATTKAAPILIVASPLALSTAMISTSRSLNTLDLEGESII